VQAAREAWVPREAQAERASWKAERAERASWKAERAEQAFSKAELVE